MTIKRPYQTLSHNIHFKITGLVRRFSGRRNCPQAVIYCCYIILNTEFKLTCFVVQPANLKGGGGDVTKTKECRGKKDLCPFLLLENSRPLSPLREPQTPLYNLGTPNFLSTYLKLTLSSPSTFLLGELYCPGRDIIFFL